MTVVFVSYFFNSKTLLAPRKAAVKLEKEEQNEGERKKTGETPSVSEQKDKKRLKPMKKKMLNCKEAYFISL